MAESPSIERKTAASTVEESKNYNESTSPKVESKTIEQRQCRRLFDATTDVKSGNALKAVLSPPKFTKPIPKAIICNETGKVMADPVLVIKDGHTYEREAITFLLTRDNRLDEIKTLVVNNLVLEMRVCKCMCICVCVCVGMYMSMYTCYSNVDM